MKKVILLALLMPHMAFGQIVENFESGSIVNWVESTQGHWNADTTSILSENFSLHHIFDNPDAGIDCIGLPVKNLHPFSGVTKWSFIVRYGYDPSSLNNWSVFLMSDNGPDRMSSTGGVKGFALGVNFIGSDDTLRLWKVKDNIITPVVNCGLNWQTDIGSATAVKISAERSPDGKWSVSVFRMTGVSISSGSGYDSELFSQGWFGFYYRYSSTRDRLLWLDDINIEGTFYNDNEAPIITRCELSGKKSVEITLNEEPGDGIMIPDNISLNAGENKSMSVLKKKDLNWLIEFADVFTNKSLNTLIINKLCDISGNCTQDLKFSFTPLWAETGDIVISEIMADPAPPVSLPDREYIELTNRSGYSLNLKNWVLSTTSQQIQFPETIIPPGGIIIISSSQDTNIFNKLGRVIGLKQFPSLNDAGRLIFISDSCGSLIHGVEYSMDWYKDDLKAQGGWSLEMIDTAFPFYDSDNWKASVSRRGGTPGLINSVSESNPDRSFNGLMNVFAFDSSDIQVTFSEPVFNLKDNIKGIRIGAEGVIDLLPIDPLWRKFSIKPDNPIHKKELYDIEIPGGITDFAGNQIQKADFSFGRTEQVAEGDILFNEILFNPYPGDQDYLEFYNTSEKIIDVSRLQLVSLTDAGEKSEPVPVSDVERCLLPGRYYAVTTGSKGILARYFSANENCLFETESLPAMSDDKGHLILYDRELDKIDELLYNDEMHYSLLTNHEGVALEKADPVSVSLELNNWHSASESSGWGTPGSPNSVFVKVPSTKDDVVLSSSKISPDNDGYEDFLIIKMALSGSGNVVTIMVFDETGTYVRKIAGNLFAGSEASLIWDGTADDGSLVSPGIYIILITLYNDTGKTAKWKKVCTVIR